ncbi:HAD-IA family hydrolase [Martelella mangrovi]|uniref:Phosphoglycolate phosphatase n=1 Tax=Martelella mangrovi TaxID=1397477 RepID=A0ABV2IC97_9HYPH
MKLVLFDCDGTLVDSAVRIHETMRRAFIAFGHPEPTLAETKTIIGLSLDLSIARLLGRQEVDDEVLAIRVKFKSLFAEVHSDPNMMEQLFPGIAELIAALAARDDITIGAVTGNSRRGLNHVLELHGLAPDFSVSRTADDCPSKPHPAMVLECCVEAGFNPADAVVVGDAVFDMQMAGKAGAHAIGVAWGYGEIADLQDAGAGAIVWHPEEILKLV